MAGLSARRSRVTPPERTSSAAREKRTKRKVWMVCRSGKVVCFEMGEINPTLDAKNTMADNAFEILEVTTQAITDRLANIPVSV